LSEAALEIAPRSSTGVFVSVKGLPVVVKKLQELNPLKTVIWIN